MGKNEKFWATTTTPDVVVLQPLLSQSLRSNFIKNEFVGTNDIYTNILQHHGMPKQVSVKLKK